jgi:hypothetical protein
VAIATSPAVMAHVTTETGVVTMIIMGAGCWLPADPQSCRLRQGRAKIPAGDHRSGTAARTAGTEDTR